MCQQRVLDPFRIIYTIRDFFVLFGDDLIGGVKFSIFCFFNFRFLARKLYLIYKPNAF